MNFNLCMQKCNYRVNCNIIVLNKILKDLQILIVPVCNFSQDFSKEIYFLTHSYKYNIPCMRHHTYCNILIENNSSTRLWKVLHFQGNFSKILRKTIRVIINVSSIKKFKENLVYNLF